MDASTTVLRVWTRRRDRRHAGESYSEFYSDGVPSAALCDVFLGHDGSLRGLVLRSPGWARCWTAKTVGEEEEVDLLRISYEGLIELDPTLCLEPEQVGGDIWSKVNGNK